MPPEDVPIRPAATVVLLREVHAELEVLLLQRNTALVFGGDHWVFPGGRIDAADFSVGAPGDWQSAARQAAIRETHEEAGLDITGHALTPVSHWTTPAPSPKRYNTAFFVTTCEHTGAVTVDGSEIVAHEWISPRLAISHYDTGSKKMMPPTIHTLREIADHGTAGDFITMCAMRSPLVFDG